MYYNIFSTITILFALILVSISFSNSCLEDNCVVLEKQPNETLVFSAD
jgi:hypothetical protein